MSYYLVYLHTFSVASSTYLSHWVFFVESYLVSPGFTILDHTKRFNDERQVTVMLLFNTLIAKKAWNSLVLTKMFCLIKSYNVIHLCNVNVT